MLPFMLYGICIDTDGRIGVMFHGRKMSPSATNHLRERFLFVFASFSKSGLMTGVPGLDR